MRLSACSLIEIATLILLTACSVNPPKPYVSADEPKSEATYILVPGWLSDYGSESHGGDLAEIAEDLQKRGIPYRHALVKTRNNQTKNSAIVLEVIRSTPGPLIIVSVSRGTSETAQAIAALSDNDKQRIRLWVSISGAHLGSPVASWYSSKLMRWPTAVWSALSGWGAMENIEEMDLERSRERYRQLEPKLAGIKKVSVVTVNKDCSHVGNPFTRIGCNIVDSTGLRHDGVILGQDQILPGSKIIWMEGHKHLGNSGYQADFLRAAEAMS